MKKVLFTLLGLAVIFVGCNVGPSTSGPDQQTFTNSPYNIIPSETCEHQLVNMRGHDGGANVVEADDGTVYECDAGHIHEAFGGEIVHEGHFADNYNGSPYSLSLSRGYELEIGGDGVVEISGAASLQMLLPGSEDEDDDDDHGDDDEDGWVNVPGPGTYQVLKLRKAGDDHNDRSEGDGDVSIVETVNVVIVNKSGGNEND